MAKVDVLKLAGWLKEGNLSNGQIATGIAIARAESALRADAKGVNDTSEEDVARGVPEHTTDRGLWQWNDHWHGEITDDIAYDAYLSTTQAVVHLRFGEKGYRTWNAYKNGSYERYLDLGWTSLRAHNSRVLVEVLRGEVTSLQEELKRLTLGIADRVSAYRSKALSSIAALNTLSNVLLDDLDILDEEASEDD